MTFITTPLMRSFVGFDNLFDEFERMSSFTDNNYPATTLSKQAMKIIKSKLLSLVSMKTK